MTVEIASFISELVPTNPATNDPLAQGDDHIRLLKAALKASFPLVNGALNASMVAFIPTGGLAATTVAGALAELDSEKYSSGGNLGTPSGGNLLNCSFPQLNQNTTGSAGALTAKTDFKTEAALPTAYPDQLIVDFAYTSGNWPSLSNGSIVTMKGYSAGGGTLQLYTPYGETYGGKSLKFRKGNYDVNGGNSWTPWRTLLDSGCVGTGLNFSNGVLTATAQGSAGVTSVGGHTGPAVTAGQVAAAATEGYGFTPAPNTAYTSASTYSIATGTYTGTIYLRLTRANNLFTDIAVGGYDNTPPPGSGG